MKNERKKKINLKNIWNYIEALFQYFRKKDYIEEIADARIKNIKKVSPECLQTKAYCNCNELGPYLELCPKCNVKYDFAPDTRCVQCGCQTMEKAYQQQACEFGCFGERPTKQQWKQNKKI